MDFIDKFDELDMDDIEVVKKLAENFTEWCRWNKSFEDIEVIEPTKFRTIVVVHNLWDRHLSIYGSWEFLLDVKYFLKEYCDNGENEYNYCYDFWYNKYGKM